MIINEGAGRDLSGLVVPRIGRLIETTTASEHYCLVDATGVVVEPVSLFFRELMASGCSVATVRSYGMDLLRWWRFLAAVDVVWDRASRIEARDFSCWIQSTVKPRRSKAVPAASGRSTGAANPTTGKPAPDSRYAVATVAHSETVLRGFYDFHLKASTGPIINPFPLDRSRRSSRANAHHNPMNEFHRDRVGRYRPRVPQRIPRGIPDEKFDEIFPGLRSDRDRVLVAFWVSTGARASELLGMRVADVDPGQQVITVVRKGTRAVQQVPASPDAFVHLRIYQQSMRGLVPVGRTQPLWWTLRRPFRPLTYHAAHRMFDRVNAALGAGWTLHDLRHCAARRMAGDPQMPLTHVQAVMGHAALTTTQRYLIPGRDKVIEHALAHHARQAERQEKPPSPLPGPGYDPQSLAILWGRPEGPA
ncbi:site-specific integrase [Nocardia terpenica]|uniref:tyrosine-type recombinase/integrase n=1 Tax=Nocardia terpenica TaxID=455432 RepID=UPI002FE04215